MRLGSAVAVGTGARPWTPARLGNLRQELHADVGITIESGVRVWSDKSGQNDDYSQFSTSLQPTLTTVAGVPMVVFDGVNDVMTAASNITDATITIFCVAAQLTTTAAYKCILATAKHTIYARSAATDNWEDYLNPDQSSGVQLTGTPAVLEICARAVNDVDLAHNGAQVTRVGGGAYNNTSSTTLGSVAGTFFGNIGIADLYVFGGAMASSDRQRVRKYLGTRRGIAVT